MFCRSVNIRGGPRPQGRRLLALGNVDVKAPQSKASSGMYGLVLVGDCEVSYQLAWSGHQPTLSWSHCRLSASQCSLLDESWADSSVRSAHNLYDHQCSDNQHTPLANKPVNSAPPYVLINDSHDLSMSVCPCKSQSIDRWSRCNIPQVVWMTTLSSGRLTHSWCALLLTNTG